MNSIQQTDSSVKESEVHTHQYDQEDFVIWENYGNKSVDKIMEKIGAEKLQSPNDSTDWKLTEEQMLEYWQMKLKKTKKPLSEKALKARRENARKARLAKLN